MFLAITLKLSFVLSLRGVKLNLHANVMSFLCNVSLFIEHRGVLCMVLKSPGFAVDAVKWI